MEIKEIERTFLALFVDGNESYNFIPFLKIKLINESINENFDDETSFGQFEGYDKNNLRESYIEERNKKCAEDIKRLSNKDYLDKIYEISKEFKVLEAEVSKFKKRKLGNPVVAKWDKFYHENNDILFDARYDIKSNNVLWYEIYEGSGDIKATLHTLNQKEDATYEERIEIASLAIKGFKDQCIEYFDSEISIGKTEYKKLINKIKEVLQNYDHIYLARADFLHTKKDIIEINFEDFTFECFMTVPLKSVLKIKKAF